MMKHACLMPPTHSEDLTAAMATALRTSGMTFGGPIEDIENRAFGILWHPHDQNGFSYSEIKPRLSAAIDIARRLGAIDLHAEVIGA